MKKQKKSNHKKAFVAAIFILGFVLGFFVNRFSHRSFIGADINSPMNPPCVAYQGDNGTTLNDIGFDPNHGPWYECFRYDAPWGGYGYNCFNNVTAMSPDTSYPATWDNDGDPSTPEDSIGSCRDVAGGVIYYDTN